MQSKIYKNESVISPEAYLRGINAAYQHYQQHRSLFPLAFFKYLSICPLRYRLVLNKINNTYTLIKLLCQS